VRSANGLITAQLAPEQVVAAVSIDFDDALTARDVERIVVTIERRVREVHPNVVALFIKPQSDASFHEAVRERFG
jgi:divalent metal cation (Fe/Co/Zn/Cd) transporter